MRRANVFYNGILAGELTEFSPNEYVFRYDDGYFADPKMHAVSLTLPKTQQEYQAPHLFPYFYNLLSEGTNRATQARLLKIDENDNFGLLLATAGTDTIGAITIRACLDFSAERILGPGREIFATSEGDVGVPTASEEGVKSTGSEPKRPTGENFKQVLKPAAQ